jgi:hypothetical protein
MGSPNQSRSVPQAHEALWVFLLLAVTLLAAHHNLFLSGFTDTQGGGDSVLANYLLEHDWRWLTRQPLDAHLFTPPIFFPQPGTLAYSDLYLGLLPFYAPWRAIGASPQTAFQLWMITVSSLNFLAAYLLLRLLLKTGALASGIGAVLFAFGSPRLMQIGHPAMLEGFYVVGAMAGLWILFREPPEALTSRRVWTAGLLLVLSAVAQFYSAFYYAWFMAFCGATALLFALLVPSLRHPLLAFARRWWLVALGCTGIGLLLVAPAALPYYLTGKQLGLHPYAAVATFLPGPLSWFAQGPEHWLYGPLNSRLGIDQNYGGQEKFLGIGFITTALVVGAFLKFHRKPVIRIWMFTSAVAIITSLTWEGFSLWRFVYLVFPGAQAVRAISRFGLFLLLPASMGLALSIEWLSERRGPALAMLCIVVAFIEQAGVYNQPAIYTKQQVQASADAVTHALVPECQTFLFSWITGATSDPWMHLIGMWAGLSSNLPALNGYSGQVPRPWPFQSVGIANRFDRVRLYDGIRSWMLNHPREIGNVCWVTPGTSQADVIRREDLQIEAFTIRRAYLGLLERLPRDSEVSKQANAGVLLQSILHSPEFRERERFAFAAYRSMFARDPSLAVWLAATEDLASNRRSREQLIDEWQRSDECRAVRACSGAAPDDLIRKAVGNFSPQENEHQDRVLLYYCLRQRAPSASDGNDTSDLIPSLLEKTRDN